jgi:peptidoglycan glycosyltransferase
MAALVVGRLESKWTAARFERLLARSTRSGAVESFVVERTSAVDEAPASGRRSTARVPYAVTYASAAASHPVRLEGSFRLGYDGRRRGWRVLWHKQMLWPGIPAADRFRVRYRWPQRAPILDRRGRRLARGSGGDRAYPFGTVGGSVVGHVASPRSRRRTPAAAVVGASGLEGAYEDRLAGEPLRVLLVVSRKGRVLETLGRRRGRRGRPVQATIDALVQRGAERALANTVGAVVVLEPSSGDLLAAVSSGSFDPNNYVGAAELSPFNRALSGLYPPGSSLKVLTASAALDSRTVTPSTRLTGPAEYKGVRNFESGSFGRIDFAGALRNSVNTAFAQVAEKLGGAGLSRYARAFGFGRPPAMALEAATSSFPRPRDNWDLMWSSIGQAQVLATPLEMASIAATIANRGRRLEPRATTLDPVLPTRVVARRTAREMASLMSAVVVSGTGTRASIPGVQVAGKTGTAEVDVNGLRRNHAWFICFAPVAEPRVAVAVVAEYGGVGGEVAAPLAGRVLEAVLPLVQ